MDVHQSFVQEHRKKRDDVRAKSKRAIKLAALEPSRGYLNLNLSERPTFFSKPE